MWFKNQTSPPLPPPKIRRFVENKKVEKARESWSLSIIIIPIIHSSPLLRMDNGDPCLIKIFIHFWVFNLITSNNANFIKIISEVTNFKELSKKLSYL